MAAIAGMRGSANVAQGLRKVDFSDQISLLQPDASPLTILSKRLGKEPTHNAQYQWAEDDLDPRFSACPGGATNVATSVTVTAGQGSYFQQHDLVKVTRTGEVMRVSSVSTDTLTVVRGVGQGGTGTTINAADELLLLGSAQPEGDTSKPARSNNSNVVSNYTQIFRKPVHMTDTWIHSDQYVASNDWDYQVKKQGIEHMKDIEENFLFGRPSEDTSGSQPRRTTGGALQYIATNVTAAGGTLSEASFFSALRPGFRYGSGTKLALASGLAVDVLNGYPRSKVQIPDAGRDTYGLSVIKYQSPHGVLNLVRHWLLEGSTYNGYLVGLDMASVKYRFLANSKGSRDTHFKDEIQAPDEDSRKGEFITEAGFQLANEKQSFLITGITG